MSSLTATFYTLGCKLNQLETESIAQAFKQEGFLSVSWGTAADLFIVNTCTVTSMAEQKARRIIRKTLKENQNSCLIITGCYAQLDRAALEALAADVELALGAEAGSLERRRFFVVSGDAKASLLDLPCFLADSACSSSELPSLLHDFFNQGSCSPASTDRFRFDANDFTFHSRASLKIQDGCDNVCTYCRVRIARGKSVSLSAAEALIRLQNLEKASYAEAVLTGINISRYTDPNDARADFSSLIRLLLSGTKKIALRISSTEPDCVDEGFAEAIADPRVRPHFHLSIQSGSNAILKKMRRRYAPEKVFEAVRLLRKAKGDPFLACDIITGFPGEGEEDFEQTYRLCTELDFAWIHAFPFSPRPGTDAALLSPKVSERVAGERVVRLGLLAKSGRSAYIQRWIGEQVSAIAEASPPGLEEGHFIALTENYLRLSIPFDRMRPRPPTGSSLQCQILSSGEECKADAYGKVL